MNINEIRVWKDSADANVILLGNHVMATNPPDKKN
jgi:hypothetical protein